MVQCLKYQSRSSLLLYLNNLQNKRKKNSLGLSVFFHLRHLGFLLRTNNINSQLRKILIELAMSMLDKCVQCILSLGYSQGIESK